MSDHIIFKSVKLNDARFTIRGSAFVPSLIKELQALQNDRQFVDFEICKRKEPDFEGKTHYMRLSIPMLKGELENGKTVEVPAYKPKTPEKGNFVKYKKNKPA